MSTAAKKTPAARKTPAVTAAERPKVEARSTAQDARAYRVTSNLHVDGLKLRPGDEVELTDHQAAGLQGFVEALGEPAADSQAPE